MRNNNGKDKKTQETQHSTMAPSNKPGWIDWRKSPARQVLIKDLQPGGPLHMRDNLSAEDIFGWYKQFPAFKDVVFDQFQGRLQDHRAAANKIDFLAQQQEQYMKHDREIITAKTHNNNGEKKFHLDPAKKMLQADIEGKKYLNYATIKLFQASRPEYEKFKYKIFYDRYRQEIKLQKYFNYLEITRDLKLQGKTKKQINHFLKTYEKIDT